MPATTLAPPAQLAMRRAARLHLVVGNPGGGDTDHQRHCARGARRTAGQGPRASRSLRPYGAAAARVSLSAASQISEEVVANAHTTVICSDKTGTITANEMTARTIAIRGRYYTVHGPGIMRGYHHVSEGTHAALTDDSWFRTATSVSWTTRASCGSPNRTEGHPGRWTDVPA